MKKLFDHLFTSKVTPNGLLVLHATHNKYSYLSYINFKHEQHRLELTGYLTSSKVGGITTYTITQKGLHLIKESQDIFEKTKARKAKSKVPFSDWEQNIEVYNKMFPEGKKQGSSIAFRTTPKELFERFKWFFLEYPEYSWEDVMIATKVYLKHYEEEGSYTYMQISKYFIKKSDQNKNITSNLATMCYNIAEGNDGDIDSGTFYYGP